MLAAPLMIYLFDVYFNYAFSRHIFQLTTAQTGDEWIGKDSVISRHKQIRFPEL